MDQSNYIFFWKLEFAGFLTANKAKYKKSMLVTFMLATLIFNRFIGGNASAQIIPDNTLGVESSTVELNVDVNSLPADLIRGGTIRGTNLFHSFERFNVGKGKGAYFVNPTDVQAILSRVTGNSRSNILGKLGVLGNADLFLFNPNGIIFGQNSSLDLNGSFLATTANQLSFADGTLFSAKALQSSPILTISTPVGLKFEGANGDIVNLSQTTSQNVLGLQVQPGQTLALVGGNVKFQGGFLTVPTGKLELGSVDNGQVSLRQTQTGWTYRYDDVQSFLDIELDSVQRLIGGFDSPLNIPSIVDGSGDGGDVQVHARNIVLKNGSQIRGTGANISVTASKAIEIVGISPEPIPNRSGFVSATASTGDAGNITITTGRLIIKEGGFITAESAKEIFPDNTSIAATGNGGNLILNASEFVLLTDEDSSIKTSTQGPGDAGKIRIATKQLTVKGGAQISTATSGSGNANDINIVVDDSIQLSGSGSGLFANTTPNSTGDAGGIFIDPVILAIQDGATITVNSQGTGSEGAIDLQARNLRLDRGTISATSASGRGGNINLTIKDLSILRNNSQISAEAGNNGNGGNITFNTDLLVALENSDITANAFRGRGGNIQITTRGLFRTPNSRITASSERGIDGVVEINNPEVDPSENLIELPETVETPKEVTQGCRPGQAPGSSTFVHIGRGGLPSSPYNAQTPYVIWQDLRARNLQTQDTIISSEILSPTSLTSKPPASIVEAKGWTKDSQGRIHLTAHQPKTLNSPKQPTANC